MDIKQIQEGSSVFFLTAARPRSRARKTIGMKWSGASCHFNFNLFFTRLLQIMEKKDPWKASRSLSEFCWRKTFCMPIVKNIWLSSFLKNILWLIFWVCLPNHCSSEGLNPVTSFSSRKVFDICIWWQILILFNLIVKNRIRS